MPNQSRSRVGFRKTLFHLFLMVKTRFRDTVRVGGVGRISVALRLRIATLRTGVIRQFQRLTSKFDQAANSRYLTVHEISRHESAQQSAERIRAAGGIG